MGGPCLGTKRKGLAHPPMGAPLSPFFDVSDAWDMDRQLLWLPQWVAVYCLLSQTRLCHGGSPFQKNLGTDSGTPMILGTVYKGLQDIEMNIFALIDAAPIPLLLPFSSRTVKGIEEKYSTKENAKLQGVKNGGGGRALPGNQEEGPGPSPHGGPAESVFRCFRRMGHG